MVSIVWIRRKSWEALTLQEKLAIISNAITVNKRRWRKV